MSIYQMASIIAAVLMFVTLILSFAIGGPSQAYLNDNSISKNSKQLAYLLWFGFLLFMGGTHASNLATSFELGEKVTGIRMTIAVALIFLPLISVFSAKYMRAAGLPNWKVTTVASFFGLTGIVASII
ncbi:hypothetical protein [Hyphococcus luteus]|uniref:hypothetical protein n=1 Tax=Hyphococcus luteus TaxID=2058213 RepID=UPI001056F180|nr:hypothetical protein [Marinicaulis flavus]